MLIYTIPNSKYYYYGSGVLSKKKNNFFSFPFQKASVIYVLGVHSKEDSD